MSRVYSLLVWMAPVLLGASLWRLVKEPLPDRRLFWAWSVLGIAFVVLLQRLGGLGMYFLYLSCIVLAAQWSSDRGLPHGMTLTAPVLLIASAPTLRWQLLGRKVVAMDEQFSTLRPIIPALVDACRVQSGAVLATPGDGHLVRCFLDCSVIANNFRLTPMGLDKVSESLRLIGAHAADLHRRAPYGNHVLARSISTGRDPGPGVVQ